MDAPITDPRRMLDDRGDGRFDAPIYPGGNASICALLDWARAIEEWVRPLTRADGRPNLRIIDGGR